MPTKYIQHKLFILKQISKSTAYQDLFLHHLLCYVNKMSPASTQRSDFEGSSGGPAVLHYRPLEMVLLAHL